MSISPNYWNLAMDRLRSIPTLNEIANDNLWLLRSRHVTAAQIAVDGLRRLVEAEKELVEVKTKVQQLQHENKNLTEQAKLTAKSANTFKDECKSELTKRHAKLVDEINEQRQRISNLDAETESLRDCNTVLKEQLNLFEQQTKSVEAEVETREAIIEKLQGDLTDSLSDVENLKQQATQLRRTVYDKATKLRETEHELSQTKQSFTVANAEAQAYKDKLEELYEILARVLGKNEVPTVLETERHGGCDGGAAAHWHDDIDALKVHSSGYEEFHSDRIPSGVSG